MFCVKKKESSPLYRKCRLSASTKSAGTTKATDPRRVKSAEVFTRTGYWAKQHKPVLKGGELLPKQGSGVSEKVNMAASSRISSAVMGTSHNKVDFCVTNSKEYKTNDEEKVLPRVNHDSLHFRNNTIVPKQISDKIVDKTVVLSPRFIPGHLKATTDKLHPEIEKGQNKAKTVTVNYVINSLVKERNEKDNTGSSSKVENSIKNMESPAKSRIFSASQRSIKTDINSYALCGDESKEVLNAVVQFCDQEVMPTFCKTCSGIYSGNAPPPPTPATCTNCVHGINLLGTDPREFTTGPSQAEIQKVLAQNLVRNEKVYCERVTSAKIELKMSEARLTEDSIHYSAEREMVRNADTKRELSLPTPFDDLEDERNISFQDDGSNQSDNNENLSGTNMSLESPLGGNIRSDITMENGHEEKEDEKDGILIKNVVTITTPASNETEEDVKEAETNFHQPQYFNTSSNHDTLEVDVPRESFLRRGSRRQSISFTYKPEVSNISKSNNLLRVLSIDDCKIGMRYTPHKVLEDHEVTDNPMAEMIKQATGQFGSDTDEMEGDSQIAMRLSQNSSVTSLHSSSANDVTIANKMQYKILFGPEDLNQYRNLRPQSAYLTKAFQTMIHDRTIMQRLDRPGSSDKAKNTCTIARTIEGPKYKIINTALKREMGNMLQAQRQNLLHKYEQQKLGNLNVRSKKIRTPSRLSGSTDKSLSLDSLPSVKKGILKH